MATTFSQNPIALRNAFSLLDDNENVSSPQPSLARTNTQDSFSDKLSVSSWSVVNSAIGSDNEDNDTDNSDDEIYTWNQSGGNIDDNTTSVTLANRDGFTTISKTMTASSINSVLASAPELRDVWVVKVAKRRSGKLSTVSELSLDDIQEDQESSEDDNYDALSMTDHELSKSAKAVKLKNLRLATAADKELFRVLGFSRSKVISGSRPHSHKIPRTKQEKGRSLTGKI
ncbi:hypothetical protein CPB97_010084 [Podila verticillata]|nr:hypothetical protein CPB97_010084 [Podila verticillata]